MCTYTSPNLFIRVRLSVFADQTALELDLFPPGSVDFTGVEPECTVPSQSFAAALFAIYLCPSGPLVGARDKWAAAARALMQHPPSHDYVFKAAQF